MSKQTTVDAKALDAKVEQIAAILVGRVNAPEGEIYRVASDIAALSEQPAPDHAGLIERLNAIDEAAMYEAPATTEATIREAIAALSRAPEAIAPRNAAHKEGCEHARSPIWLCDCPRPYATPPAPRPALSEQGEAAQPAAEGWREISEENGYPPMDTDVILGWWRMWPKPVWEMDLAHYGSERGRWMHGQATHWLPVSILPASPGIASQAEEGSGE